MATISPLARRLPLYPKRRGHQGYPLPRASDCGGYNAVASTQTLARQEATPMTARCSACGAEVLAEAAYCTSVDKRSTARHLHAAEAAAADPQGDSVSPRSRRADPAVLGRRTAAWPSQTDEEKLWEGGYSAKAMLGGWLLAALVTVVVTVSRHLSSGLRSRVVPGTALCRLCFGGIGLYVMYRKLSVHYTLTSQRFIHQVGLLRRVTDRWR